MRKPVGVTVGTDAETSQAPIQSQCKWQDGDAVKKKMSGQCSFIQVVSGCEDALTRWICCLQCLGRDGHEVKEKAYVCMVFSADFGKVTQTVGAHFATRWHHDVLVRTGSSGDVTFILSLLVFISLLCVHSRFHHFQL